MKAPQVLRQGGPPAFVHSVRFRLTLWFVLILALVLATFSGLIYWAQARSLRSDVARRLEEQSARARAALAEIALEHEAEGAAVIAPLAGDWLSSDELLMLADTRGSILGVWGLAVDQPQAIVSGLLAGGVPSVEPVFIGELRTIGADGQAADRDYAFITSTVEHDGRVAGYMVFGRQSDVAQQLGRLAGSLLLGSVLMLGVAFLGGLWLADRAMRPVAAITHAARSIGESDLGRRLNLPGRDELADLAMTFDQMIERLQVAFERQKRFVAELQP